MPCYSQEVSQKEDGKQLWLCQQSRNSSPTPHLPSPPSVPRILQKLLRGGRHTKPAHCRKRSIGGGVLEKTSFYGAQLLPFPIVKQRAVIVQSDAVSQGKHLRAAPSSGPTAQQSSFPLLPDPDPVSLTPCVPCPARRFWAPGTHLFANTIPALLLTN